MIAFQHFSFSLDQKRKDLIQEKEELLKDSKVKSTTLDSVKTQIELLVKVELSFFTHSNRLMTIPAGSIRDSKESR
jgi:hypothetical protein